jgi:hypothetical protein
MSYHHHDIDWNDIIKKEAKGKNDKNLGKVKEIQGNYVLVQRGIIDKEIFYIPKDQIESYDGHILNFKISESDLKTRYKDEPFMKYAESNTIESDMNKVEEELDSLDVNEK